MSHKTNSSISITSCFNQSIEEFGKGNGKFDFNIKQFSNGCFQGQSITIDLGGITIIRRSANTKYTSVGKYSGYAIFVFPINIPHFTANDQLHNENTQLVLTGNLQNCSVFPENSDQIVISIKLDALKKYFSTQELQVFIEALKDEKLSIISQYKEKLTNDLCNIYTELMTNNTTSSPTSNKNYCKTIITLLYTYTKLHQTEDATKSSNYGKIFHRAFHYIDRNHTKNINMDTLSSEIYASKRSVQYAFFEAINLPPIHFIKKFKMNKIREELLSSSKKPGISAILQKYHITNIGRFSHEYFELFGERPKETIGKEY